MRYPSVTVSDGTNEAIKWLALLLMAGDHANKYLFKGSLPMLFNGGRLAMPLFVLVLAYNLARPGSFERGAHIRTMKRLAAFGVLATPAFIALGGLLSGWWPLNFMFALLTLTLTIYLLEYHTIGSCLAAGAVFILGGSSVEYWWPGLLLGIAAWSYCKSPRLTPLVMVIVALLALRLVNGNYWAMAALPVAVFACFVNIPTPRYQWAFYVFYPLHLAAIWTMTMAGTTFN